jgi:hypothetical protein
MALPLALLSLALLVPLMLAFASLAVSEPVIASNQLRASQARALADSGLGYALRALGTPAAAGGLPSPLPASPAPAPFDGRTLIALGLTGGFTVTVADHAGGDPQARTITAVGWPAAAAGTHRQVVADAAGIPHPGARAPCALCVGGTLGIDGNVAVSGAGTHPDCGGDTRYGALAAGAAAVTGPAALAGGAGGLAQHQSSAALAPVVLSPAVQEALRALALRAGTYYGPGFPRGGTVSDGAASWDGRVVFDAVHPLPDGLVFVDTTDARAPAPGATDTLAAIRLDGGATGPDGVFDGWLVVNGTLDVTAGLRLRGLVHTAGTLSYRAAGTGSIEGLVVALADAQLFPTGGGGLSIAFDCARAGGAGVVPRGFVLLPGSYREERD